jgi:hypothetical protein
LGDFPDEADREPAKDCDRSPRTKEAEMTEHEFWRERSTGRVYAVRLVDGLVTGWCGPLDASEVEDEFLPSFDYSEERAGWVDLHREEFELFRVTAPYG